MRVYSPDFNYLYRISGFLASQETKLYIGAGVLTIVLAESEDAAYYMRKNGWIVMGDGEPYIIKHVGQGLETITVTAYGCHKLLEQRITGGGALKNEYISKTGSADEVVKHFIDLCKGDLPLVTAPTHGGATISDQTRLKGLGDEVSRILTGAGRGERYTFDADNKCIVFDTYQGTDRTYGNAEDNPPVVFALKFKNIEDLTYTESAIDEQTTIYVGGAGEGSNREIIVVGNDKTGLDRVERFRDARDVKEGETDKLTERGSQLIIGTQETISTTAISDAGLVYGTDYNLGDIVTTQVTQKTYTQDGDYFNPIEIVREVNQRITEVVITREGGAEDIDLRFGDEPITATQTQSISRQVEQLAAVEATTKDDVEGLIAAAVSEVPRPNLLINPDFQEWGRGTYFSHYTGYIADRWYAWTSQNSNQFAYYRGADGYRGLRWICGGDDHLVQVVEKSNTLHEINPAGNYTLSFKAWADSPVSIYAYILDTTNVTVGTLDGVIASRTCALTSTPQTFTLTVTGANISNYLGVRFYCSSAGANIKLPWVKLEIGDTATPFIPRPYAEELALCQRYYYQITDNAGGFHGTGLGDGVMAIIPIDTPAPMRTLPTLINPSPSTMRVRVGGSNYTPSSFIGVAGVEGSRVVIRYGGSFPAGYWACAFYTSGAPVMAFDAEIY